MAPVIDPKRLRKDAAKAEQDRLRSGIGQETVGIVRAIRDVLPIIRELRSEGMRWAAIADALNAQGIYPGTGDKPGILTPKRLTAIVSYLEKQEVQRAAKREGRRSRPELAGPKIAGSLKKPVGLAPELQRDVKLESATKADHPSEEDLRIKAHLEARRFLKD